MIAFIDICKTIKQRNIIDHLSFSVNRGECLALFGPSGCGKTTTLRLLAGFEKPDQGEIYINRQKVSSRRKIIVPWKRNVGMVFQDLALWPHMTVYQHLNYALSICNSKQERQQRIDEVLLQVNLAQYSKALPHELSGGEKQRLAIARTLVTRPGIILFDEPFSNLDPHLRQHLLREIKTLIRSIGLTAIYVTHDWHEALYLSHRIAMMKNGHIEKMHTTPQMVLFNVKPAGSGTEWLTHSGKIQIKFDNTDLKSNIRIKP